MLVELVPRSPFKSILNFRDVGQTVNLLVGANILQEGTLFRTAKPDDAIPSEAAALKSIYDIQTIIDLRSSSEHVVRRQNHGLDSDVSASVVPVGIKHYEVDFNGVAFVRALIWKLSWSGMVRLFYHMAIGQRQAGIFIIGSEVMAPRGLVGLGYDSLDHCGLELRSIFSVLSNAPSYPLLVHCAQGKDRTGLTILLVLLLCEVPLMAITADYAASERELVPEVNEWIKNITANGLGKEFVKCPEDFVERMVAYIQERYGGVERYLEGIGVDEDMRMKVRKCLMIARGLSE